MVFTNMTAFRERRIKWYRYKALRNVFGTSVDRMVRRETYIEEKVKLSSGGDESYVANGKSLFTVFCW